MTASEATWPPAHESTSLKTWLDQGEDLTSVANLDVDQLAGAYYLLTHLSPDAIADTAARLLEAARGTVSDWGPAGPPDDRQRLLMSWTAQILLDEELAERVYALIEPFVNWAVWDGQEEGRT